MYKCPHCNKIGISVWRKFWLGPAIPTTCKECGEKVGVPYSSMLAVIPFMIAIVLTVFVDSTILRIAIFAAGFIIMSIIHLKWIPLVPK